MTTRSHLRYIWKVFFAIAGLADVVFVILFLKDRFDETISENSDKVCFDDANKLLGDTTNNVFESNEKVWRTTTTATADTTIRNSRFDWIGLVFCSLCLIESLVRAAEARKAALDNRELDRLERSLLKAAQTSRVKLSQFFGTGMENSDVVDVDDRMQDLTKTSRFLRAWVPAVSTIVFWLLIVPTSLSDFQLFCGIDKLNDSAVATRWFALTLDSFARFVQTVQRGFEKFFWERLMPYRIHKTPMRFVKRLKDILRVIRFARFAGPLARMFLKLHDQLRAMYRTRRQSVKTDEERQLRVSRPSMLFYDIQKLESFAKVQTALAMIPSNVFLLSSDLSSSVVESYKKRRNSAKKFVKELSKIQKDYLGHRNTAELYDRIVQMTQDVAVSLSSEKRRFVHRYLMSPRALLSSRRYLISPRTRFSLAWRMTVTNCLMLEIFRLCTSWHLSKSFSISLPQIMTMLIVECKPDKKTKHRLALIADKINQFRRQINDLFPLVGPKHVDTGNCIPSGPHASLVFSSGRMMEVFVDAVAFIDIFVWFATGDIEAETHIIIPKPFFSRCILPGTLVQVLDHPTVPNLIPDILKSIVSAASIVGWSRCVRWVLAVIPALKILFFDPMIGFMFRHIEEDEGIIHYAESVGILTPEIKAGGQSGSFASLVGHGFLGTSNRDVIDTSQSQVGLSLLDDDIQSPIVTKSTILRGSSYDNFDYEPTIPMGRSPSKTRKSVHFGLMDQPHAIHDTGRSARNNPS